MRIRFVAAILSLILSAIAAADPRTTNDAIYSKAQAKSGEQLYQRHCLICHDELVDASEQSGRTAR